MYCFKCGNELRNGAAFCDKCGAKQEKTNYLKLIIIIVVCTLIMIGIVLGLIIMNYKAVRKESTVSKEEPNNFITSISQEEPDSVITSISDEKIAGSESDSQTDSKTEDKKNQAVSMFEGEAELELPSLVTYTKERMTLGDYKEDKSSGGYVQYFYAGDDMGIINCMGEYAPMLAAYDLSLSGTLSNSVDGCNYTCYLFTYNGTSDIERGSINFNDAGDCDMCIIAANDNGEAYIAAYIPEGVSFVESGEKMKNSY